MLPRSWFLASIAVSLLACSEDEAPVAPDAGLIADTSIADVGAEQGNLLLGDGGCPGHVAPGAPCEMSNMQCAAPVGCEACGGGYVKRAATCVCEAFWTCDHCAPCPGCDAGPTYIESTCTQVAPTPDAGKRDAALDAGEGG